jgi:outer membrane receptor for ferrienterochelin and colicins
MQLGAGGEKSELEQSGPSGLTRNFWRPKGSLSLAWAPNEDMDVSLNISRRVGQLSFG